MEKDNLRAKIVTEIMKLANPPPIVSDKKPTIDELEKILNGPDADSVRLNTDGTISTKAPPRTVGDVADAVMHILEQSDASASTQDRTVPWSIEADTVNGLKGRAVQALNALACKDKRLRSPEEARGHLEVLVRGLNQASIPSHHYIPQLPKSRRITGLWQGSDGLWREEQKWHATIDENYSAFGRTPQDAILNALEKIPK